MRLSFRNGVQVRDAGEFKESEHPRAKNGQFTSGGGVVGSKIANNVTAPKKGTLSHSIWSAGAKMLEDGKVPNKTNVMEALAAQGITANASTVGTQLAHLKKFLQGGKPGATEPVTVATGGEQVEHKIPPKPKLPDTKAEFINQAISYDPDMQLEGTYSKKVYYKNSAGEKLSYDPDANTWMHNKNGEIVTGTGMNELNDYLTSGTVPAAQPHKQAPAPKPQPPKPKVDNSTLSAPVYAVKAIPHDKYHITSKGVASEKSLPDGVRESMTRYKGSYYTKINNAMRFTTDFSEESPQTVRDVLNLTRAFQMVPPTEKELNLSRKVQADALKAMAKHAGLHSLDDIQVGNIFQEEGVCSTAHGHHVWSGSVKFNITLPKGSKAIDLSETINKSEHEVMLPPGTRFKITGIHPGKRRVPTLV